MRCACPEIKWGAVIQMPNRSDAVIPYSLATHLSGGDGKRGTGEIMSWLNRPSAYVFSAIWICFIVWTLSWLRSRRSPGDSFAIKVGVRQFGMIVWVISSGIGSWASFQDRPQTPLVYYVGLFGFLLLPLALWLGFLWGKGMWAFNPSLRPK